MLRQSNVVIVKLSYSTLQACMKNASFNPVWTSKVHKYTPYFLLLKNGISNNLSRPKTYIFVPCWSRPYLNARQKKGLNYDGDQIWLTHILYSTLLYIPLVETVIRDVELNRQMSSVKRHKNVCQVYKSVKSI